MQEMEAIGIQTLSCEDPLGEGIATHSNILAWRIPWTENPGRLQSMRSQRVGRECSLHFYYLTDEKETTTKYIRWQNLFLLN